MPGEVLTCNICKRKTVSFDGVTDTPLVKTIVYPNCWCNIAIKLDCGHYMFDDCDPKGPIRNGDCAHTYQRPKKLYDENGNIRFVTKGKYSREYYYKVHPELKPLGQQVGMGWY